MSNITLHTDSPATTTCVPNVFIDRYMVHASGEFVKIYLYLLRCINGNKSELSISKMADKFEHTEKDIKRALCYWEKLNLLRLEYDNEGDLSGIYFLDSGNVPQPQEVSAPELVTAQRIPNTVTGSTTHMPQNAATDNTAAPATEEKENGRREYSTDEMDNFREKEDVRTMLFVAEKYLKRPLTPTDMQMILYWYDSLGFSAELVEYLIEHCIVKGHPSLRYMDKVALSWAEQGITDPKQAQMASRKYDKTVYTIMKSLGKNTSPAPKELEYINKWTKEYGFLLDVIQEACDKTVMTTDSHRFAYADGILTKWYQAGVRHKADIAALDASYQRPVKQTAPANNRFNRFAQNSYDFDQLEQNILSN